MKTIATRTLCVLCALWALGCDDSSPAQEPPPDAAVGIDARVSPPLTPTIEITAPEDGATLASGTVEVIGTVSGTEVGVLPSVDVHGVAATVMGDGRFTASVPLADGVHTLTATVADVSDSITITIDSTPPRIDIIRPERGTYAEAGQVDLDFTITDDSALDEVSLDGRAVDSGLAPDFLLQGVPLTPGINILQLEASDAGGNRSREHVSVMHGTLGDAAATLPGALRARLGTAAVDGLEVFAAQTFEELDLASLLPADEFNFDPFLLRITEIDYTRPISVQLNPETGYLDLELRLTELLMTVEVQIGEREPRVAGLGVGSVVVTGRIEPRVVDGRIVVDLIDPAVNLSQLEFRFGDVPDFEEDPEEGQSILEETISRALELVVNQQLTPLIQGFLADLDTSFEVELLGAQLQIEFIPNLIVVSTAGIAARVDGRVNLMNPAPGEPRLAGPLSTPTNWDGVPVSEHIAIAIDDDFINLLLYQVWRSGALFPRLDQAFIAESNSQISIVTGVLGNLLANAYPDVNRTTPMAIDTALPLPPVARVLKSPDAVRLELGFGDLSLDVRTDDELDRQLLEGYASLRLQADIGLSNGEDGLELALDIVETETAFDVATEALRGKVENSIEDPINTLLGSVGGILPGLLGDIPLPAVDILPLGAITTDSGADDPNFLVITVEVAQ